MSSAKHRQRLVDLLKELFQLNQPELDFGLYKIMHAKSVQITKFLENDLLKEIEQAFGDKDSVDAGQLKAQAVAKLKEALGDEALDENGHLQDAFKNIPAGKKYLQEIAEAEAAKDTLNAESEVYDHLYRFFERYYDSGDFMSRRYYARESDARAAPYSVPYDGREVYLHWANKDQYYIKSSEYLTNYTFELNEAIRLEVERQKGQKGALSLDLGTVVTSTPKKVHFRIVDASEGEHGNSKASSELKRFFILNASAPVLLENDELIIQFQYRTDSEKPGKAQDKTWQESRLQLAEVHIIDALKANGSTNEYVKIFELPAPTDSKEKRTLLGKYLQKYTARNTMDYFIHKDLGGFLRRELDFYIKNEIIRIDDIENSEPTKVEGYLLKIRVLRRIAHQLISFIAQIEEFQKKVWLKKKFVTEVNYCLTIDKIAEKFYKEIASNKVQIEQWVKLFSIDEIKRTDKKDMFGVERTPYSTPLTVDFIKENKYLIVDTALFDVGFTEQLLSDVGQIDDQCDGVLIHSENFSGLLHIENRYSSGIKLVLTDPPYNTKTDVFPYKDSYKHSSWMSMMHDRIGLTLNLLTNDGMFFHHIDENEHQNASILLTDLFTETNRVADIVWKNSSKNGESYVSMQHEYIIGAVKNSNQNKGNWKERKEGLDEIYKAFDGFKKSHGNNWKAIHQSALDFYNSFPDSNSIKDSAHYSWMDEKGVYFPDNISKPAKGYFYDLLHPVTGKPCKKPSGGWRFVEETMLEKVRNNEIHFGDDHSTVPNNKTYLKSTENQSLTSIKYKDGRVASGLLKDMFGEKDPFKNPKDVELTSRLLKALETDGQWVLDIFSGSGTTQHALIDLSRYDKKRKYIGIEMGGHFDKVLLPRIKKAIYSKDWKDGKPVSREGVSHFFKYIRLESYEDALNNLVLKSDAHREAALEKNSVMQRDYLLNYFLDVETQGSNSLLNIEDFRDPTAYKMQIKKPGSEEQVLQSIDLVETFNWLIGLWIDHLAAPQKFSAEFEREVDADLPKDQNTRLVCKKLKIDAKGEYWFRLVEGYTLKVPGDVTSKMPALIVWRKQTDDAERDNAVLQKYLMEKLQISPRENTYSTIYVNGSHTLPNPVVEGEQVKVRLIEEAFHSAMWAGE